MQVLLQNGYRLEYPDMAEKYGLLEHGDILCALFTLKYLYT